MTFRPPGGGSTTFIGLTDVPASYSGQALKVARVNAGETALEFATVSGTGDVVGPASATDNAIVRFDGTTGKLIQNYTSGAPTVDDTGNMSIGQTLTLANTGLHLFDTDASHDLIIIPGSNLTADRNFTITTGDAARTLTMSGDLTVEAASLVNQDLTTDANVVFATSTVNNTGLHILDTNASHDLVIVPGSDLTADRNLTLTTGDAARTVTINGDATISSNTATSAVNFIIDGGGATITTGVKGDFRIPFGCTITEATLMADQSGSIVVDIWKDVFANFPPTVADTITAAAKPTLSAAASGTDTTLTGWTTSVAAGDTFRVNVDSISTCQRVTLMLKFVKT